MRLYFKKVLSGMVRMFSALAVSFLYLRSLLKSSGGPSIRAFSPKGHALPLSMNPFGVDMIGHSLGVFVGSNKVVAVFTG